jgi:hypothetical protein
MTTLTTVQYTSPVSKLYRDYYLKKQRHQQQRGGKGNGQFGQIYHGQRFPQQQNGSGLGSFLGTVARGIANLIQGTPSWVKTGAKLAGQSALKGMSEYAGDVEAGVPPDVARKRAFKSSLGNILMKSGEKLKGGGVSSSSRKKQKKKTTKKVQKKQKGGGQKKRTKKTKCCTLKVLSRQQQQTGGRRRRRQQTRTKKKTASGGRRRRRQAKGIKRRTKFDLFSV